MIFKMANGKQVSSNEFDLISFHFFVFILDEAETIGGPATANDARRIQNQINVLAEENNMLKLKVEILMNLVAESVAELPSGRS